MVKEFAAVNNTDQILKILKVLQDFVYSQNPHARKGGLIGLAAVAIALGQVCIFIYLYKMSTLYFNFPKFYF